MPRSALFVTLIIMTFFIFFALAKNDFIKIMILASGCLVASFIRPEYFLGSVAFIIFAIVLFVLRKESTRFFLTTIFPFSLLWFALISWAGNPFTDGYATRGFWAFGQNFSYNYATWEKLNINPWTNSDTIIEQHFGNSHNLFLAFLANPVLILKHFFSNLLLYFKYIYLILFVHLNIILPSSQRIFSFIESLMVVGLICYLMARNRTTIRSKLPIIFKEYQMLFISFAIIYLQSIFIIILTIPRHEFITIHLIMILTFFLLLCEHCFPINLNYQTSTIILVFLVTLSATPYISNNWYFTFPNDGYLSQRKLYNYKTIKFIQALNLKDNINILEAEGGINVYLGPQFRWVPEYEKKESFFHYLDKRKINAILSTDNLVNDVRFRNDTEWREFFTDYQQYGFSKYAIPDTDRAIYVKKSSLP